MKLFSFLILALVTLANCTPQIALGPIYLAYPENRPIEIELRNFSFYPNHIAVFQNQAPLTFHLSNTAEINHNFTLIDNQKDILIKIDIMPKESIDVTMESLNPENYIFYCDRFLHRRSGMEGMLMVTE